MAGADELLIIYVTRQFCRSRVQKVLPFHAHVSERCQQTELQCPYIGQKLKINPIGFNIRYILYVFKTPGSQVMSDTLQMEYCRIIIHSWFDLAYPYKSIIITRQSSTFSFISCGYQAVAISALYISSFIDYIDHPGAHFITTIGLVPKTQYMDSAGFICKTWADLWPPLHHRSVTQCILCKQNECLSEERRCCGD